MYIHELKDWSNFQWNQQSISDLLIQLRYKQGCLIGSMGSIGFHLQEEAYLKTLTQDIIKSSEIEGEILDQSLVRSSVARHLGIETAALDIKDRNIEGIVDMTLDATQNFSKPLTRERLWDWHTSLFPMGRSGLKKITIGAWRSGPVQVVSGNMARETVHFEAPSADHVAYEMDTFLKWINHEQTLDPILKTAIAHFWFVTIHPFDDGNGRIGRAIADLLLARSENSSCRFYSLSAQIQADRKGYYAILEKTQKGSQDITEWIVWFINCLGRAIDKALTTLNATIRKSQIWESLKDENLNHRQKKIINLLIDGFEGKLTTSKWAKIAKCSQDTAYRDILDLVHQKILIKNPEGGRSTSYSLQNLN